jgi:hypothetical protein
LIPSAIREIGCSSLLSPRSVILPENNIVSLCQIGRSLTGMVGQGKGQELTGKGPKAGHIQARPAQLGKIV